MDTHVSLKRLRMGKGIVIFITFTLIGIFLTLESHLGVMSVLVGLGIEPLGWSALFLIFGLINLIIGVGNHAWNPMWFTPLYMYTTATAVAVVQSDIPMTPFFLYMLLSMYTVFECVTDWLRQRRAVYHRG